ncbi:MAG: M20/M25/M40 family metallo-hydrolase, partial [Rhodospirillales bacterium]|nr:M20/M25/M40 family metallo-hydrolase [Rhodospirillales bacterium]
MSAPIDPVAFAQSLIRCPSITPAEGGALDLLQGALEGLGFTCRRRIFQEPGSEPVDNLYAHLVGGSGNLCYAGHTDVVPPGNPAHWRVAPFAGAIEDGWLIGRGTVDMKGAIACYVAALSRFLAEKRSSNGLSLLITGDEEGPSINGTRKMLDWLLEQGEHFSGCIVGEPTSVDRVGDMAKIGRRGSLNGWLTISGVQGHSAYPHLAD